jgi:hypothetical protein
VDLKFYNSKRLMTLNSKTMKFSSESMLLLLTELIPFRGKALTLPLKVLALILVLNVLESLNLLAKTFPSGKLVIRYIAIP